MKTRHSTRRRHLLNSLLTGLLLACSLLLPISGIAGGSAVILVYHHVADDTPAITSVSPARFREQLDYLASGPFNVISTQTLLASLREGKTLPPHSVVITFDDAYKSVYSTALPMLEERQFPATLFVATDLVGSNSRLYMNWDNIRDMAGRGFTIANHTSDHNHLLRRVGTESDDAWLARIRATITDAQTTLAAEVPGAVKYFAYPYGEYDTTILQLVTALGYVGFGQQSGATGPDASLASLPRFPIAGVYAGMDSFRTKVRALPMPFADPGIDPTVIGEDARPPLRFSIRQGSFRLTELACYGPGGKMTVQRNERDFVVSPAAALPVGRSRYNCTMPSKQAGRYHWFSQPWIRRHDDGSWYPEP